MDIWQKSKLSKHCAIILLSLFPYIYVFVIMMVYYSIFNWITYALHMLQEALVFNQ